MTQYFYREDKILPYIGADILSNYINLYDLENVIA